MVCRRNRNLRMSAAHTHPNIELNYLQRGQLTYLHGGIQRTVESGRLSLFWAGVPHQSLAADDTGDGIWVQLPLAWFLQWKLPRDLDGRLLAGEFFSLDCPKDIPERWLQHFQHDDPDWRAALLLELQAALAVMSLQISPAASREPAGEAKQAGGEEHISRVTRFIAAHYHDENLNLADIAREAKLCPHYLTALFKRRCHVGLWEYVTRLRVSHAQRLLVTTDLRVLDVAMESGFGSLAPFYRSFTRFSGMRPLVFRRQQRQPATANATNDDAGRNPRSGKQSRRRSQR